MRVWIVMGNDYPHSVHDTEAGADAEIRKMEGEAARSDAQMGGRGRIYWRHYDYMLQEEGLPPCP